MLTRSRDPVANGSTPDDGPLLLGVDEARERILEHFSPLPLIRVPLDEALGYVLGVDVIAGANVPPFANSAMDGYAVRAEDVRGATPETPVRLAIVGEAGAGHPAAAGVGPGTTVRIMTGGPVSAGADAVVRFEDTDEELGNRARPGGVIGIFRSVAPGQHIRPAGEDIRAGATALVRGTALRPGEIGVLATLNRPWVTVHRRPVVAILATGDEIVDPGQSLGPGQIYNSNSAMLAAMVRAAGGESHVLGVARDAADDLRAKLRAASGADLLVTVGGVSVGDYDLVKQVLRAEGTIDFWRVRIKPGKPLAFGLLDGTPLLGLPGNPAAAAVAFEQFGRPAIRKMAGRRDLLRPVVNARLADRVENTGGRRRFVWVRVDVEPNGFVAYPVGAEGSGQLSSLVRANGLLIVPEDVAVAGPGEMLTVQMLDWES